MKALVYRLRTHPFYLKAFHWGKFISITGFAQVIVQALGLACGILIIRMLSPHEYALYTLANTMLSTMTVLAECDISAAIMALGGKVWNQPQKLGVVLVSGMKIRKRMGLISLVIVLPIFAYLLFYHGASVWVTALLILSIVPAFFASLTDTILEVPPKLNQHILPLQKNQVMASAGRLFLTTGSLVIIPFAFVAILASGISRIWANVGLRKISTNVVDWSQHPDPAVSREMIAFIKRILPMAIYYGFSGQITIWLISIFGSTDSVAEIGALSRLTAIMGLVSVLVGTLVAPRFARLAADRQLLFNRYAIMSGFLIGLFFVVTILSWLFAQQILWVLGNNYASLKPELVLSIAGSSLALLAGAFYALNSSRGWIINPMVAVSINILAIIVGAFLLDISTLQGILVFNMVIGLVSVLMHGLYGLFKINRVTAVV